MDTDRYTVTRSGLRIGCAYQAPPPQPSADAEAIQQLLLASERAHRWPDRVLYAIAIGVVLLVAGVLR